MKICRINGRQNRSKHYHLVFLCTSTVWQIPDIVLLAILGETGVIFVDSTLWWGNFIDKKCKLRIMHVLSFIKKCKRVYISHQNLPKSGKFSNYISHWIWKLCRIWGFVELSDVKYKVNNRGPVVFLFFPDLNETWYCTAWVRCP